MNENHNVYSLDEFASFEFMEDESKGQFVITVKGDAKYGVMIADKIGRLTFSTDDLNQV
jgi:hypothetical protein